MMSTASAVAVIARVGWPLTFIAWRNPLTTGANRCCQSSGRDDPPGREVQSRRRVTGIAVVLTRLPRRQHLGGDAVARDLGRVGEKVRPRPLREREVPVL